MESTGKYDAENCTQLLGLSQIIKFNFKVSVK